MKIYIYINKIKNLIIDMLFPIECLGCRQKDEILCNNCISKIHRAERETDKNIIAVFDYRDEIIKKAIWSLKYHHKKYLGKRLGELLYEFLLEDISDLRIEVSGRSIFVIPVPISSKKTKVRGYNQSLSIAKGFSAQVGKNILEIKNKIIFKKIETTSQAKIMTRGERLENIKGVFELKNKEIIKGRTIIIIDDVTTTGGTINEMIKVFKNAGAKNVIGFAIAH